MSETVKEGEIMTADCKKCGLSLAVYEEDILHQYDYWIGERYFYINCVPCDEKVYVDDQLSREVTERLCEKFST